MARVLACPLQFSRSSPCSVTLISMSAATLTLKPMPWAAVWMPLAYLMLVAAEFLALTHITLTQTERGDSALMVGGLVAAFWGGILGATATTHGLVRRFGPARVVMTACALEAVAMALMAVFTSREAWVAGLGAVGFLGGLLWVCCEAWMAKLAPEGRQGAYIGAFEMATGLGMMGGPAALVWLSLDGGTVLWLATATLALACVVFSLSLRMAPQPLVQRVGEVPGPDESTHSKDPQHMLWLLALMGAFGGIMESGVSSLLPSLGMRLAFDVQQAALLGVAVGAGSAFLQVPAGLMCDRWGSTPALRLAWWVLVLSNAALLVWGPQAPWLLWLNAFVLGGVGGAVYTLVVSDLGYRLQGTALVRGMSRLVTAYTLSTLVGPLLGGWSFDVGGLPGTATLLLALSVAGLMLGPLAERWHSRGRS